MSAAARSRRRAAAPSAFSAALERAWAITPAALRGVLRDAAAHTAQRVAAREGFVPPARPVRAGTPLAGTQTVTVRDGVATLSVAGVLLRYDDWMAWLLDGAAYEAIERDFVAAMEAPGVRALLIEFDSPGGDVNGCGELAATIASARGTKPIVAYASGDCCSAGYYLASACDAVVAAPAAVLGCLGVQATYLDTSRMLEAIGIDEIEFVSSQTPNKNPDPATDAGRAQVQRTVDDLAAVFLADVGTYRGLGPDPLAVAAQYGAGDVFVGARAVDAGLADRLGSYRALHAELAQGAFGVPARSPFTQESRAMPRASRPATAESQPPAPTPAPTESTPGTTPAPEQTPPTDAPRGDEGEDGDETPPAQASGQPSAAARPAGFAAACAQFPDDARAYVATARAEAAAAERARILAVQAVGAECRASAEQVAAAVNDPACTEEQAALRFVRAGGAQRASRLAALQGDEAALRAAGAPSSVGSADGGTADPNDPDVRADQIFAAAERASGGRFRAVRPAPQRA